MDTSTIDLLRKARALIEQGWSQGCGAKDANGFPVSTSSQEATSYCAIGALEAAGDLSFGHWRALEALRAGLPEASITGWNDARDRTKEEVLDLYDRVIAGLEAAV